MAILEEILTTNLAITAASNHNFLIEPAVPSGIGRNERATRLRIIETMAADLVRRYVTWEKFSLPSLFQDILRTEKISIKERILLPGRLPYRFTVLVSCMRNSLIYYWGLCPTVV